MLVPLQNLLGNCSIKLNWTHQQYVSDEDDGNDSKSAIVAWYIAIFCCAALCKQANQLQSLCAVSTVVTAHMQNLYVIILCAQVERVWAYIRDSAKETAVITTKLADIGQTLSQLHATLNSSFQVTLFIQLRSIGDHTLN